ncbi:hypothetical protein [Cupriavidus basilensis]
MIIVYRADNGEITRVVTAPDNEADRNVSPGEAFVLSDTSANWRTQYVVDGAVVAKPASPASLASDTLLGLPVPSLVVIQSKLSRQTFYSDAATQQLTFTYPGEYRIWVQAPGYLDGEFTYTKA